MKPYWFLWISLLIIGCTLLARTLVINFTEELSRDMGLNSEISYSFGIINLGDEGDI
jgi:hypothetical protein